MNIIVLAARAVREPAGAYRLPDQRRKRPPGRTSRGAAALTTFFRTNPPSAA